ncbi:TaqI family restriction endonuclease [Candidatus Aerophobetes bacterium]|nr:TaqI family restriction endonuclease [Candidatus Aerophobetes bacterium]
MKNPENDLKKYRDFLETIPLNKFREELKNIKWVEQDLPKEMLPLTSIFKYYWDERQFLSFDGWFETFWKELDNNSQSKEALKQFKKYYFDKDNDGWFKKGFKARMYRTWVSVLTQLDFCYVFEYACAKEEKDLQLEANAELDVRGIDAKVSDIGFQVAKVSQRKEARTASGKKTVVTIPYVVWNPDKLKEKIRNPRTRIKDIYQKMINSFEKYFIKLPNGFVVFKENYLKVIIDNIDNIEVVRKAVKKISLELSGES